MAYQAGEGVQVDNERAVHYFRLAAEQGSINARYMLAMCYRQGLGVGKSHVEAVKHLRISAAAGDDDSQTVLAEYLSGCAGRDDIEPDYDEAIRLIDTVRRNSKCSYNQGQARFYFSALQWHGQGNMKKR
jgi:TPR repeat protein